MSKLCVFTKQEDGSLFAVHDFDINSVTQLESGYSEICIDEHQPDGNFIITHVSVKESVREIAAIVNGEDFIVE